MRSSRGFTLFELLVVMGLIAVMAGIASPTLSGSTARNSVWTASEVFTSTTGIPTVITVTYTGAGTTSRALTMSAAGQINFETY